MIRSGIPGIDGPLNGGFCGGFITDIFGPPASGKTQLVFQMCANAVIGGHSVLFLDTKGEFRPERILQILKANDGDEVLLEKIQVLRVTNSGEQISGLSRIRPGFSLVVIDGITELFSFEFGRSEQFLERNKLLMRYMHCLSGTAIGMGIPAVVTNTVRIVGGREVENLGSAMAPFAHVRIRLGQPGGSTPGELSTVNRRSEFSFVIDNEGVKGAPQSI